MSTTQQVRVDRRRPMPAEPETQSTSPVGSRIRALVQSRIGIAVLVAVGGMMLLFGATTFLGDLGSSDQMLVYYTVKRTDLPITVSERGNLESQQTMDIICEVENFGGDRSGQSGTQILTIVPNGASVKKGDLLVELDAAPLKERLDIQFLDLQRAETDRIQAEVKYQNQQTQNETAEQQAELTVELASLELDMYEDEDGGTFQIDVQEVDMQIREQESQRMIDGTDLDATKQLYDLGYRNKGDLAAARLRALSADQKLARLFAMRQRMVDYDYRMQKLSLTGKLETAERGLIQVRRDNESQLAQAKAAFDNAVRAYEKEKERYDRYTEQLEKCKIVAPQDGMVAYSVANSRYSRGSVVEEGAFVRQRQEILSLPNLKMMQVSTAVHESVLDQVRRGLPATIRLDAFSDRAYKGSVKSVAVLPDPGDWSSSDTKIYKTIVTIDEEVDQLKPGMTAVVEIHVARLEDVISIPVQAIVQIDRENWVYVGNGRSADRRPVKLGRTNDKFVEIVDGLVEGERVVLNPMSIVEEAERKDAVPDADDESQEDTSAADSKDSSEPPGDLLKQEAARAAEQRAGAGEAGEGFTPRGRPGRGNRQGPPGVRGNGAGRGNRQSPPGVRGSGEGRGQRPARSAGQNPPSSPNQDKQ